ncbi:hypothetical protein BgiBS90_021691 [Biomphalaria glabrata]|nr:hypothetical protein BgiBS90_021691 [Biomphalaria glabrata]
MPGGSWLVAYAPGQDVETVGETRPEPRCLEEAGWCLGPRQDVGTVGETRPEPRCLEEAGWWPMTQARREDSWRDSPRTETPGGSWLVAYDPGKTWRQLERLAQNRDAWRKLVGGLCPRQDVESVRETRPEQRRLEEAGWWPMSQARRGDRWRDSPRTETPGGSWLVAYVPGKTWRQLERLAQNRDVWRKLVGGLCPRQDVGTVGETRPEPRCLEEAGWWPMGKTWRQLERLAQNRDAWRKLVGGLWARLGDSWRDSPRTETPGRSLLVANALEGTTGRDERDEMNQS